MGLVEFFLIVISSFFHPLYEIFWKEFIWNLAAPLEFWFKMLSLILFSILDGPFWLKPLKGSLLVPIGGRFA